jgi:ABC-2 type transport system permease protein
MAGKVLGVGAVGLSQLMIWGVAAGLLGTPGIVAAAGMGLQIPLRVLLWLPVFFLLGFALYSASYAALGASVNTEQEAQQFQLIVMLPLILAITMMYAVIRQPNSGLAIALSLFPFTAPVLMYLRMVVSQPPAWQLALSLGLMLATVYGVVVLCARIYRVGILMYGKRPTLPEILRWLRYA